MTVLSKEIGDLLSSEEPVDVNGTRLRASGGSLESAMVKLPVVAVWQDGRINLEVGRCKNCRHWDSAPGADLLGRPLTNLDDEGRATCEVVTTMRVVGGLGEDGREPGPIWTAPEFGCVLFEPKGTP
jgi:hypothetical protein